MEEYSYTHEDVPARAKNRFEGVPVQGQAGRAEYVPTVRDSAGELEKSISELGESLYELRQRLEVALRPAPPEPAQDNAKRGHPIESSPLAIEIGTQTKRLQSLRDVITDIHRRLDLG